MLHMHPTGGILLGLHCHLNKFDMLGGSSLENSFNRGFKWNASIGETFIADAG